MDLPPPVRMPMANGPVGAGLDGATRAEIAELRALVAAGLGTLARRLEQHFGPAIEAARRAWESADDVTLIDPSAAALLTETRRALYRATGRAHPAVRAVALEGLLAFDAACGLTGLAERRLSSLIRLRVASAETALLPDGRPFLDLGAAIKEAAREWS